MKRRRRLVYLRAGACAYWQYFATGKAMLSTFSMDSIKSIYASGFLRLLPNMVSIISVDLSTEPRRLLKTVVSH